MQKKLLDPELQALRDGGRWRAISGVWQQKHVPHLASRGYLRRVDGQNDPRRETSCKEFRLAAYCGWPRVLTMVSRLRWQTANNICRHIVVTTRWPLHISGRGQPPVGRTCRRYQGQAGWRNISCSRINIFLVLLLQSVPTYLPTYISTCPRWQNTAMTHSIHTLCQWYNDIYIMKRFHSTRPGFYWIVHVRWTQWTPALTQNLFRSLSRIRHPRPRQREGAPEATLSRGFRFIWHQGFGGEGERYPHPKGHGRLCAVPVWCWRKRAGFCEGQWLNRQITQCNIYHSHVYVSFKRVYIYMHILN